MNAQTLPGGAPPLGGSPDVVKYRGWSGIVVVVGLSDLKVL